MEDTLNTTGSRPHEELATQEIIRRGDTNVDTNVDTLSIKNSFEDFKQTF